MSSFNWIRTVLVIITLTSLVSCGILNQKFVPPSPENEPKLPLTEQDQIRIAEEIKNLTSSGNEDGPSPWELSGLFEGDMLVDPEHRNMLLDNRRLWPKGIVPYYVMESEFTNQEKIVLLQAMKEFHNQTCIRFRPYHQNDPNWIVFRSNSSGCWSSVGKQNRGQTVNLQTPDCVAQHGTVIHELLHALGFVHQQSASNRDDFVRIQWENIENGTQNNFAKFDSSVVTDHGIGYDYGSIMHYHSTAFSKNGKPTIVPLKPNVTIGQSKGFSEKDLAKLKQMYGNQCNQQPKSEDSEFLDQFNALLNALGQNSTHPTRFLRSATNVTISNSTTPTVTTPNVTTSIATTPSVTSPSVTTLSVATPKGTSPQVTTTQQATTLSAMTPLPPLKKHTSHSDSILPIPIFSEMAKRILSIPFG